MRPESKTYSVRRRAAAVTIGAVLVGSALSEVRNSREISQVPIYHDTAASPYFRTYSQFPPIDPLVEEYTYPEAFYLSNRESLGRDIKLLQDSLTLLNTQFLEALVPDYLEGSSLLTSQEHFFTSPRIATEIPLLKQIGHKIRHTPEGISYKQSVAVDQKYLKENPLLSPVLARRQDNVLYVLSFSARQNTASRFIFFSPMSTASPAERIALSSEGRVQAARKYINLPQITSYDLEESISEKGIQSTIITFEKGNLLGKVEVFDNGGFLYQDFRKNTDLG